MLYGPPTVNGRSLDTAPAADRVSETKIMDSLNLGALYHPAPILEVLCVSVLAPSAVFEP